MRQRKLDDKQELVSQTRSIAEVMICSSFKNTHTIFFLNARAEIPRKMLPLTSCPSKTEEEVHKDYLLPLQPLITDRNIAIVRKRRVNEHRNTGRSNSIRETHNTRVSRQSPTGCSLDFGSRINVAKKPAVLTHTNRPLKAVPEVLCSIDMHGTSNHLLPPEPEGSPSFRFQEHTDRGFGIILKNDANVCCFIKLYEQQTEDDNKKRLCCQAFWCPHEELNLDLKLRRLTLYPFEL